MGVAVVMIADPTVTIIGRGTRDRLMQEQARVAKVATTPPPPEAKQSPKPSRIRQTSSAHVSCNRAHVVPVRRSSHPGLGEDI